MEVAKKKAGKQGGEQTKEGSEVASILSGDAEQFKSWLKAAEQGHATAQHFVGSAYFDGEGVEQNLKEAFKWWMKAAEQGNDEAQCSVGYAYQKGNGVEKNLKEAFKWYIKAAEQGHAEGQLMVGTAYYHGNGVEQNLKEAFKWWMKAAEQGNDEAQCSVGYAYQKGNGVEKNLKEAFKWKMKAAEQGHAAAQLMVGDAYFDGDEVEENLKEAFKWSMKAAEQGHAAAQCSVGYAYQKGNGVEQNLKEGFKWSMKAAEQGNAAAQCSVGYAYFDGEGVDASLEEAVKWLLKAKKNGIRVAASKLVEIAKSHPEFSLCHHCGMAGAEKKCSRCLIVCYCNKECQTAAWKLHKADCVPKKKAGKQGGEQAKDASALASVLNMDAEEFKSCLKAAEQGDDTAQRIVAFAYVGGNGVRKNLKEAFKWYMKAAEKGHATAQYWVGIAYLIGEGVDSSVGEAVKWLLKAKENGNRVAASKLVEIAKSHPEFSLCNHCGMAGAEKKCSRCLIVCYCSKECQTAAWKSHKADCVPKKKAGKQGGEQAKDASAVASTLSGDAEQFKSCLKLAEQGHATAQYNVGYAYYDGEGVDASLEEAVKWLLKAKKNGIRVAASKLVEIAKSHPEFSLCHHCGMAGAEKKCSRCLIVCYCSKECQTAAWKLHKADCVPKKKAGKQGGEQAKDASAVASTLSGDVEQFKSWLKAAEQGNATAQLMVGTAYDNGDGVEKNRQEAFKWSMKAAEQGHATAQCNVGTAYFDGDGVEKNLKEAFKWYMKAAEQGNATAQLMVGYAYDNGNGVEKDRKEGFKWSMKAAEQGDAEAQNNVGYAYVGGNGVAKNLKQAFKWFLKAAEQGHAAAQYNVGTAYLDGEGVDASVGEAVKWLLKAKAGGILIAAAKLDKIKAQENLKGSHSQQVEDAAAVQDAEQVLVPKAANAQPEAHAISLPEEKETHLEDQTKMNEDNKNQAESSKAAKAQSGAALKEAAEAVKLRNFKEEVARLLKANKELSKIAKVRAGDASRHRGELDAIKTAADKANMEFKAKIDKANEVAERKAAAWKAKAEKATVEAKRELDKVKADAKKALGKAKEETKKELDKAKAAWKAKLDMKRKKANAECKAKLDKANAEAGRQTTAVNQKHEQQMARAQAALEEMKGRLGEAEEAARASRAPTPALLSQQLLSLTVARLSAKELEAVRTACDRTSKQCEREGMKRQLQAEEAEAKLCSICLSNEANCTFVPCGHSRSCMDCAKQLANCYECRALISSKQKIFR